jgi:hypothetical protein
MIGYSIMSLILTFLWLFIVSIFVLPWSNHVYMTSLHLQKDKNYKTKWCVFFTIYKFYKLNKWVIYERLHDNFFDIESYKKGNLHYQEAINIINPLFIKSDNTYLKLLPISFFIYSKWLKKEWKKQNLKLYSNQFKSFQNRRK